MFNFEKLDVWHKSIEYADMVYDATEAFPDRERFGLTNQLRRAAVSVSSNIAEGNNRSTSRDRARFIEIAYGSLMETISQLQLSRRRRYIDQVTFSQLYSTAEEIARMLSALRAAISGQSTNQPHSRNAHHPSTDNS